ncbi:hypothetical protein [Streptomyces albidoflavus]|uniref:hypothetical protein n=1 Tax=Streptomyces albidoflavus TaxID=1886 RepID=UPI00226D8353|nr:hypothetical protein [Streptomyces albidoflavus]CAI4174133.1 hypothetical protein CCOS2040_23925 [Streptomyces albidoflavus]
MTRPEREPAPPAAGPTTGRSSTQTRATAADDHHPGAPLHRQPRRTTLARLADAASLQRPATRPDAGTLPAATANPRRTLLATTPAVTGPAYGAQLPGQTANPVRTILMTAPAPRAVPAATPEPAVAAAE